MPFNSMMQLRASTLVALMMAASVTATSSPALATRLDENRCTEIQAEHQKLVGAGVRDNWLKGPAWARDNLPRTALDQIAHLIYLDEQLTFRCPLKFSTSPLKPSTPEADDTADKDDDGGENSDEKSRGMPLPSRRPSVKASTSRDSPSSAGSPQAASTPRTVAPKAASPTKNDAYIPPPPALAPTAQAASPAIPAPSAAPAPATPPLRGTLGYTPSNENIPSWAQQIGKSR